MKMKINETKLKCKTCGQEAQFLIPEATNITRWKCTLCGNENMTIAHDYIKNGAEIKRLRTNEEKKKALIDNGWSRHIRSDV